MEYGKNLQVFGSKPPTLSFCNSSDVHVCLAHMWMSMITVHVSQTYQYQYRLEAISWGKTGPASHVLHTLWVKARGQLELHVPGICPRPTSPRSLWNSGLKKRCQRPPLLLLPGSQPLIAAENIQKYIRKENGYHSLRAPLKATMQNTCIWLERILEEFVTFHSFLSVNSGHTFICLLDRFLLLASRTECMSSHRLRRHPARQERRPLSQSLSFTGGNHFRFIKLDAFVIIGQLQIQPCRSSSRPCFEWLVGHMKMVTGSNGKAALQNRGAHKEHNVNKTTT